MMVISIVVKHLTHFMKTHKSAHKYFVRTPPKTLEGTCAGEDF